MILFKNIEFFKTLTIGIPPPIAASNKSKTLFDSAILNNCSPCLDNSALFAVTTLIFFSKAFLTNSKLIPFSSPINSTKTLQLFIFNKSNGSLNHLKSSTLNIRFFNGFYQKVPHDKIRRPPPGVRAC